MDMKDKDFPRKFEEFAEWMRNFHHYDFVEVVPSLGIADFYKGINSYTYSYKTDSLDFNPTISETQIKMLEKNPRFFLDLRRGYFMDNQDTSEFSEEKSKRLLKAATIGLEKIENEQEKAIICDQIREKYENIKKDALEKNK